jgi:excisionase family DNA binding protein
MDSRPALRVKEAAKLLKIDPRTLRTLVDDGRLAAAEVGRGVKRRELRISHAAIEAFLAGKRPARRRKTT